MEQLLLRQTNALPYDEIKKPKVYVDLLQVVDKYGGATYINSWDHTNKERPEIRTGFIISDQPAWRLEKLSTEPKVLIGRTSKNFGLHDKQLLFEWIYNPLTERFESAFSVLDITRQREAFGIPKGKYPRMAPWVLEDSYQRLRFMDYELWQSITDGFVTPNEAQKILEQWFGPRPDLEKISFKF